MNVLVMGGNGFLGSNIVRKLATTNNQITTFDISLSNILNLKNVQKAVINYNDVVSLYSILKNKDIVYNCICTTNNSISWNNPAREITENITPLLNFMELAVKANVKKIVFPSSGGTVYGETEGLLDESMNTIPYSPYGIGKLAAENFLRYYKEKHNIQNDIYRISTLYGIGQNINNQQGVIGIWLNAIINNKKLYVYGSDELRDYVHVLDAVQLMTHSLNDLDESNIFNIGTGEGLNLLQLLDIFKQATKVDIDYEIKEKRPFDSTSVVLDSSKILKHFPGFKFSNLHYNIEKMYKQLKENNELHV